MKIKGKQLEDTLRSESAPFTAIHSSDFVGNLNGAIRFEAKNTSGATISKGKAVYVTGVSGDTTPTIGLANASSALTMPAFGVAYTDIANNDVGEIVTFGNITGVNTSAFSEGDKLYISATSAGVLTNTAPTGSSSQIQNLGMVIRAHATNGTIKIGGAGRSNATPNLDEGKFFIGNASNQSVQSSYALPTVDGDSGQVLTTDGNGVLSFSTPSSGSSITTQRLTSVSALTAQKDYRYIIDSNSMTTMSITLPASPTIGDTIYFFPRYNNKASFSSAGTETITRSGFTSEPYTELFSFNEGVEIKAVYSGTEWVIESPTQEVYNWSSYTLNDTVFLRYDTIILAYATTTYTLPDQSLIPDGTSLEILFSATNGVNASSVASTLTFNAYNGNNEVQLLGYTPLASPTSSVSFKMPRRVKIVKYNSHFIIVSDNIIPFSAFDKNKFTKNVRTTATTITAANNTHYLLQNSSSSNIEITLPSISDLLVGDEIFFSRASNSVPTKVILNLNTTDAADANVRINAYGFGEINNGNTNSIALPLNTGLISVKKIYEVGSTQWYDVRLLQSDDGITTTVSTTTETLSPGFNYLVDTATAGGTVTLTLPFSDYEMASHPIEVKVVDDTYDVIIKTYHSSAYIDDIYNNFTVITFQAGNSLNRTIKFRPVDYNRYKVVSDTGANSNNYVSEITATTTLSTPYYGASSETYTVNHATNAITITLPAVASTPTGFKYNFKRIGAGTVTIDPNSTEYIDYAAQTQVSISNQYDNLVLQNTGSFWVKL
jgi:hypothetical protein